MYTPHVSAGAYIREIDLSQRIDAVSSSIGVAVGDARKGPVNQRTLVTSDKQFLDIFGEPEPTRFFMAYSALIFLQNSNQLYVTRVSPNALTAGAHFTVDDPTAVEPDLRLTNFDDGTNTPLGLPNPLEEVNYNPADVTTNPHMIGMFCAIDPGKWNNSIYIHIRPSAASTDPTYSPFRFYVDVYLNYQGPGQYPAEIHYVSQEYEKDGYGDQLHMEYVINNKSKLIRVKHNPYCPPVKIVKEAYEFLDGATDGTAPNFAEVAGAWELYREPENSDINILMNCGYSDATDTSVQRKMDSICTSRMDCVALLDVPKEKVDTAQAIDYSTNILNLNSSYSALYAPDVKIYDKYNDFEVWVPLSAFAASVCAKIDFKAQLWYAPAGIEFGSLKVLETRTVYDQGSRDALDKANVNMLRNIPSIGPVLWGQETTQAMDSSLSFLNVRRLMNFLEKSIAVASIYSVYQPNDSILRAKLYAIVETFLRKIRGSGGVYEFSIVCDETNNTPDIIAGGDTVIDVFIDPVIVAKRIHLNAIVLKTGGANFRESLSQY